jgi:hypothetical protein
MELWTSRTRSYAGTDLCIKGHSSINTTHSLTVACLIRNWKLNEG